MGQSTGGVITRRSARAILIDDEARLVLFKRTKPGRPPYWSTVGGGVEEADASLEATLHRELAEELGASAAGAIPVFLHSFYNGDGLTVQHYFVARLTALDLSTRHGPEFEDPSRGAYDPVRVPLTGPCAELNSLDLRPPPLKQFILANREALLALISQALRSVRAARTISDRAGTPVSFHKLNSIIQFVDRNPTPSLLPILRSQQQADILALLLGDPDLELSLTQIAERTGAPQPSVHREIERAERTGLVTSRKVGNTRLTRANTASPYYAGLADVLTRAFGVPAVLTNELRQVDGITAVYIYGSWAARHAGHPGQRPVGDIDVLILGDPDRDRLYPALSAAEERLGRPVEATIREPGWLETGTGVFHDTVSSRPILRLELPGS
jgi:8-oxo-dGTP pyrophosphatase MutT (NUDIX family)/DNA-binding transcriptional ArsR family regulator